MYNVHAGMERRDQSTCRDKRKESGHIEINVDEEKRAKEHVHIKGRRGDIKDMEGVRADVQVGRGGDGK